MNTPSNSQEAKGFYRLSWLQRIGFGAGDLAQNLIYQTICMYLLFFYTDVYVLGGDAARAATLAGTMFLVVRLVDVLWDPLVGTFVDKHSPAMGKYRSYLVMGGIPLTLLAILCFYDGFAPSIIYAYSTRRSPVTPMRLPSSRRPACSWPTLADCVSRQAYPSS